MRTTKKRWPRSANESFAGKRSRSPAPPGYPPVRTCITKFGRTVGTSTQPVISPGGEHVRKRVPETGDDRRGRHTCRGAGEREGNDPHRRDRGGGCSRRLGGRRRDREDPWEHPYPRDGRRGIGRGEHRGQGNGGTDGESLDDRGDPRAEAVDRRGGGFRWTLPDEGRNGSFRIAGREGYDAGPGEGRNRIRLIRLRANSVVKDAIIIFFLLSVLCNTISKGPVLFFYFH